MTQVVSIGTYLPPWQANGRRVRGFDEDAVTMAVAAGRAADPHASAQRVVLVSRDFPLLEGGNGAVLLAGLSLAADVPVSEVLGGCPAVLDQLINASDATLVIAADDNAETVGAAAALTGPSGATLTPVGRRTRSLPVVARGGDGSRHSYADPRLQREVGTKQTQATLALPAGAVIAAVAGVKGTVLGRQVDVSNSAEDPSASASAAIRVIAEAIERTSSGLVLAFEQSSATVAELTVGDAAVRVVRDEDPGREPPKTQVAEGVGIPISLAAYARAFEPKLRWEAAVFEDGHPGIDSVPLTPPRVRVDSAGRLVDFRLEPLPRTGTVYTHTTIRIPVPDLHSPYSLAMVQLDDSPVRVLLKVTGVSAGEAEIGQPGAVVLRKIATRAGIPDYGYAFWPGKQGVSA
jgi:uncharacterized OB-fold protein